MKKLSLLIAAGLIIIAGTFTSCEKVAEEIAKATEITVNTTLDAPIVAVPEASKSTDANGTFKESYVLDLASNEDLKDHLDKIQSLSMSEIQVLIQSSSPENLTLLNGTFSITDNVNGDSFTFSSPANFPLVDGTKFTINEDVPGWDMANQIIASKHAATLGAIGTIDNEAFEVNFLCSLKVKAVVKN